MTLSCYFDLSGLHLFHLRTKAGVRSHLLGFWRGSGEAACSEHVVCALGRECLVRFSLMLSGSRPLRLCPLFVQWEDEAQQEQGCWGAAGMSV